MAFATAEELVEIYEKRKNDPYSQAEILNLGDRNFRYFSFGRGPSDLPQQLTLTKAREILSELKESYLTHYLHKGTRPWGVMDVTKDLDPDQAWIGIEYETGYEHRDHYRNVVNYIWRASMHSVIDDEGCGFYPCEITFAPVNASDFNSARYIMDRFLKRNDKAGIGMADHHHLDMIGTHVNISTPSYRAQPSIKDNVGQIMGNSVDLMTPADQRELFGREPYGSMESLGTHIEGKLFDSTDDLETWKKYKKVMLRLADVVEYVAANYHKLDLSYNHYISNLDEILRGNATPEEAVFETREPEDDYFW